MWPFLEVNQGFGFPRATALASLGEMAKVVADPDGRVSWAFLQQTLRYSIARTGRADLGVLAAGRFEPGLFDLIEFTARSQPTMGGGISSVCRLIPLIIDSAEWRVVSRRETVVLEFKPPDACPCEPASTEFALACIQIGARRFTGLPDLVPREARFRHLRPRDTTSLRSIFGERLVFGAETDGLAFTTEQLGLPHVQADSALGMTLQRIGEGLIAAHPRATTWRGVVRNSIAEQLARGGCSSASVARAIAVTSRTLLRRLNEEGTTFRAELEVVRREQALAYLRDTDLSATELAYLLDFRTVPSFHRAFRRWTNMTPGDYRRKAREG